MKLRIRAAHGGRTLKLDIPSPSSLQALRDALGLQLSLLPSSIRLSLNKRDEIQGPGDALLASFGVRSGDLLFYLDPPPSASEMAQNPSGSVQIGAAGASNGAGSPSNGAGSDSAGLVANPEARRGAERSLCGFQVQAEARATGNRAKVTLPDSRNGANGIRIDRDAARVRRELCAAAALRRASPSSVGAHERLDEPSLAPNLASDHSEVSERVVDMDLTVESGAGAMELEDSASGASSKGPHSVPVLLHRVLSAEEGNVSDPTTILTLAVHAVMLETGFVLFDTERGAILEGSGLFAGWSTKGTVNLNYTLPEISMGGDAAGVGVAFLKFQAVGSSLVVYGNVTGRNESPYRLCLMTSKFLSQGQSCHGNREQNHRGKACKGDPNSSGQTMPPSASSNDLISSFVDVSELWKDVKDGLSIPLLTLLCERAGLAIPPSLLILPTELKMNILEHLPVFDLARVGCVCSEFRHLAANDELWKQAYRVWFGLPEGQRAPGGRGWKDAFQQRYRERKRRPDRRDRAARGRPFPSFGFPPRFGGPPFGITGGDYDRFPVFGGGYRGGLGSDGIRGPFRGLFGGVGGVGAGSGCELGGLRDGSGGRTGTPDGDSFHGMGPMNSDIRGGSGGWFSGDTFD